MRRRSMTTAIRSFAVFSLTLGACTDDGGSGEPASSGGFSGALGMGTSGAGIGATSVGSMGGMTAVGGGTGDAGSPDGGRSGAGSPAGGAGTDQAGAPSGGSSSGAAGAGGVGDAGSATGGAGGGAAGSSSAGSPNGGAGGQCEPNYSCNPAPLPPTGDAHQDCVMRVNQYRACACKPALMRWQEGEDCANQRALYDATISSPHAGFLGQICQPRGAYETECTGTMNNCVRGFFNEGPPPEPCDVACEIAHGNFTIMTSDLWDRVACGLQAGWVILSFEEP